MNLAKYPYNIYKINELIKGKTYKEYSNLFNYRIYTQLNKKRK